MNTTGNWNYKKLSSCIITPRKRVIVQQKYRNYRLVMYNKIFGAACICYRQLRNISSVKK